MNCDYDFGIQNEVLLKESIEAVTGPLNHLGKWSLFDYSNSQCFVELKSRNCKKDTYPTTMVGLNKVKKCNELFDYYFFFKFQDGLFYWKYKPNTFEVRKGGRCDRGRPEFKDYLFIPVSELNPAVKTENSDVSLNTVTCW